MDDLTPLNDNNITDEPIIFNYTDTDTYQNEISELYSYSEESEFFANRNAFEESMEDCGLPLMWKHMVLEQQQRAITYLMTTLEVACRSTRIKSCRALAYLVQGNFGECLTLDEQANNSKDNVFMLYQYGIFQAFVQQLLIESNINSSKDTNSKQQNLNDCVTTTVSVQIFNDSSDLRLILAVLCTVAETMYHAKDSKDHEVLKLREQFIYELNNPLNEDLLIITLFQMLDKFCSGQAPHFPVRKITLLLWKLILLSLGGTDDLRKLKERNRKMCNLGPTPEDTLEVTKNMTPYKPPVNQSIQGRSRPGLSSAGMMGNKRKVFKQSAFDDLVFAYAKERLLNTISGLGQNEEESAAGHDNDIRASESDNEKDINEVDFDDMEEKMSKRLHEKSSPDDYKSETILGNTSDSGISDENSIEKIDLSDSLGPEPIEFEFDLGVPKDNDDTITPVVGSVDKTEAAVKMETSSHIDGSRSDISQLYRGLPWTPKVRKTDIEQHLSNIRVKFLGYTLPNDLETTFGLPDPIVEGLNILKKYLYVSLSEAQLEREEKMQRYPITHGELNPDFAEEPAEKLYRALLPRLPQYMIALLKILLAASTSTKQKPEKVESLNIIAEINPDVSSQSVVQLLKMNVDSIRHESIIIKAISAILLLLLKHFKINHVYQFEYVSQQLMFANCIPLILKFLSQDISHYIIKSRSSISVVDFPACVVGEPPELTADAIQLSSYQPYCWRNMFSCINLLRVLNKLTKWKHSRIMMLVVFKSSQTLLKALNVRHPMFQLYALKLLKVQLKFLGRQWKKTNMKLISPIYQKVRHRLTDDWAYSNDNEAKPWDFQAEEFTLQNNINKFHLRRYKDVIGPLKLRNQQTSIINPYEPIGSDFEEVFGKSLEVNEDESYDMFEPGKVVPYFAIAYEKWLDGEVFQRKIDWDRLLECC